MASVRVLDVSWGPVGAVLSMLLADYGAEVIRVDRPGGDPLRRRGALRTWDRSKRSIELDLTSQDDRVVAADLAAGADVVIDGLGTGTLDRFGLGEADCRRRNSQVIWTAISAGPPEAADAALAYDALAAARLGVMADSGANRDGPVFLGHPAITYSTAMLGAIGTVAALRGRLVHGHGDRVDVSHLHGTLAQLTMEWWHEAGLSVFRDKLRNGRTDFGRRRLLLQAYTCSDGGLLQINTAAPGAFGRLMEVLGLADQISPAGTQGEMLTELTDADLQVVKHTIPAIISTRPLGDWLETLWANNVACLPMQPPGSVFRDPQVEHAGIMHTVESPELGPIEVVGPVIQLSESPAPVPGPIERIGQSSADIRRAGWRAAGLEAGSAGEPSEEGPLAGIRILELSSYFAAPYSNRLLGQLGAEVVKLEPLGGDPGRALQDPCENVHADKLSIALDLKAAAARDVVERLVTSSDIVQHNMRPGAVDRLALDEAAVRALRQDIIYSYGPGYGSTGPRAGLQSFAPLHSGMAGLLHLAGGRDNDPVLPFGNEDYYAGLMGAFGALLALVHRDRTGVGQAVEVSQMLSTVFATSEHFLRNGEIESTLPPLDHDQMGWTPTLRLYRCQQGWLCVSDVREDATRRLLAALGVALLAEERPSDVVVPDLEARFVEHTAAEWESILTGAGIPCCVARESRWLGEYLSDPQNLRSGASIELRQRDHGLVRVIGPLFQLGRGRTTARRPAPALGEHSDILIRELGITDADLSNLKETGAVLG